MAQSARMNKIIGFIFPIPQKLVDRLLLEKRNVFVKYTTRTYGSRLTPKQKVLFYASHGLKEIVGEGRIVEVLYLRPKEVLDKYGCKVFLSKDELEKYTLSQPNRDSSKKLLVLVLSKLKRYSTPKKFKKRISMAGQYLTRKEYSELLE